MTIREVLISINHLEEELKKRNQFEAGLHDKKLNVSTRSCEQKELTEKQKDAIQKDMENFFNKGK